MSVAERISPACALAAVCEAPSAARCFAACERAIVAGMLVVAYEVVAQRAGRNETVMFRSPLVLKVEADDASDCQTWNGEWLESLWSVRCARPVGRLVGADAMFVRGTAVSRDLRTRDGAIVMAEANGKSGR